MGDRVRKFAKARLAAATNSGKPSLSLAELETRFVDKFLEKFNLTERDIARAFKRFDKDGSGFLDTSEMTDAISMFLNGVDRSEVQKLVQRYDVDGDGTISLEEFSAFLISRTNPNKSEWLTVDSLVGGKAAAGALDESFASAGDDSGPAADGENAPNSPQSASHKAKIFLQNMKAMLLRRAVELKNEGKIGVFERLGKHANPLAEATARNIVSKAFLPFMKNGTRVDLTSFSRVLVKFIYPGSPPPRGEVCTWLFRACGGQVSTDGSATGKGADPDVLIDMVFDEGGVRLNKWGFVQPVAAASDVGRPQIAKGPIQRRSGALPAKTKDIAYRYQTSRTHTSLAAPSDFDARLLDRSTQLPQHGLRRQFVYCVSANLQSGEPIIVLPPTSSTGNNLREIVYASAALVVIHDTASNSQRYFDGHDDDVTCFAVSSPQVGGCTCIIASGQVGHAPELLIWESALNPTGRIVTPSPMLSAYGGGEVGLGGAPGSPTSRRGGGGGGGGGGGSSPNRGGRAAGYGEFVKSTVGLLARLGRGFFARCVVAVAFSCDGAFVSAIGGDDKHDMGIWAVASGEMMASMPTANGIPPQIKAVQWSPLAGQDTAFISRDHTDFDCDLISTVGCASSIKFWSFKRPSRSGVGAMLANRLHSIGKSGAPPAKTFTCVAYVASAIVGGTGLDKDVGRESEGQYDVLTGGDNGYVYLWRSATCIRASCAIEGGGVFTLTTLGSRVYAGGAKGTVTILAAESLVSLLTLNALAGIGSTPASALVSKSSFDRPSSSSAAGAPSKRVASAPPGTAGGFGIFSSGPAAGAGKAGGGAVGAGIKGASGGTGRLTSGGGAASAACRSLQLAQKTPARGPTAAQQQWSGPGEKEDASVVSGVAASSALLGLVVLPAEPAPASSRPGSGTGAAAPTPQTPVLLVTTGFGRVVRVPLPSARALAASGARGDAAVPSSQPAPETLFYFHYGAVWALAPAPLGTAQLQTPVFGSGGDDCWLCVWDARQHRLLSRSKCPVPIRSIAFAPLATCTGGGASGAQGGGGNGWAAAPNLVACGHASGIVTLHLLSAQKPALQRGHAFSRADHGMSLLYSLQQAGCRRDCREDISDVKFSPNGKMLAAASHDNLIDVYGIKFVAGVDVLAGLDRQEAPASVEIKALRRLRGHSSYVNHIDWSLDSRLLQSTCGAYELLYWDVAKGGQLLSSADTLEGDTRWASRTVTLGFGVMGIWPPNAKGTDINAVDVDEALGLCVTSDDCGRLSLFNYPCIVADAPSKIYSGHSSHVLCARFLSSSSTPSLGPVPPTPSLSASAATSLSLPPTVVSVGGNDCSCIQWAIARDPARIVPGPGGR